MMLKEVQPYSTRPILSLQMLSSRPQYIKHSYSFKEVGGFSYLCVKTQPLKFSILMFENNCLMNVRSFTLKTNQNKQICFLNLETQDTDESREEKYEILVGYKTGEFDIYKIVGNNAKLIEASKETLIIKKQFLEVAYQPLNNQILIVNKNVLTSIEIKYPFRLQREQEIQKIECCEVLQPNTLVTGGKQRISIYEVINFNRIKTIEVKCSVIRINSLDRGYFVSQANEFLWLDEEGSVREKYGSHEDEINNILINKGKVWVIFKNGRMGCLEQRPKPEKKKRRIDLFEQLRESGSQVEQSYQNPDSPKDKSVQERSGHLKSIESKESGENSERKGDNQSLGKIKEESFIDELEDLKDIQENSKEKWFTNVKPMDIQEGMVSLSMVGSLIAIASKTGVFSLREVIPR